MPVLLDENMPIDFAAQLQGHMDQNLPHQQNLKVHRVGFVLVIAPSSQLRHLVPLASAVLAALAAIRPGELVRVGP